MVSCEKQLPLASTCFTSAALIASFANVRLLINASPRLVSWETKESRCVKCVKWFSVLLVHIPMMSVCHSQLGEERSFPPFVRGFTELKKKHAASAETHLVKKMVKSKHGAERLTSSPPAFLYQ